MHPAMIFGSFFWMLGAFTVALGVLVVVHEFGHYAVARLCGVKILRFSVGFGRVLWMRRHGRDGTEWALSAFPLGGYVKMLDERDGTVVPEEWPRAFNRQGVGRRSLIVLAGPLSNLLFAVLLYWSLFMVGVDEPRPILAAPPAASFAAAAKVGAGETVRSVTGKSIATWSEFRWELLQHILDRGTVTLETVAAGGDINFHRLDFGDIGNEAFDVDVLQALGFNLQRLELAPVLGDVLAGSPAAVVGLQPGDRILAIDGEATVSWSEVTHLIRAAGEKSITLSIRRGDAERQIDVKPEIIEDRSGVRSSRIGIAVKDDPAMRQRMLVTVRYDVGESLRRAVAQTWDTAVLSLRMAGRMLLGELSLKNISGPVTIADYAGQSARMGLDHYLRFLALISISLGVLNLLPIPLLDGGHLMYYFAEIIKGRPLSERTIEISQQVGLAVLGLMMALAFFNDINRLFF